MDHIPCPDCGSDLTLEFRPEITGYAFVAGVNTKFSAVDWPWLICSSCDFAEKGKFSR